MKAEMREKLGSEKVRLKGILAEKQAELEREQCNEMNP